MLEAFGALNQPFAHFHNPSENLFVFWTFTMSSKNCHELDMP